MITHYDLFAGIGGFSIALEEVFNDPVRHIFCEWESFPTAVLKRHWPDGQYFGDIADLVTHTKRQRLEGGRQQAPRYGGQLGGERRHQEQDWTIVTGGFPCQPFSHAGRRRGTADDRYQWPNMFAVIRNVKPEWVIAENVRGLVTWNEGMVLETVCSDLEGEGYEVQPFIIPAVAVNAPHRRDRVWIIGHAKHDGLDGAKDTQSSTAGIDRDTTRANELRQPKGADSLWQTPTDTGSEKSRRLSTEQRQSVPKVRQYPDWQRTWQEVAFATCNDAVDDGLSRLVDGVPYSRAKWRKDSLKAYGNGIVPQVAVEIMKAIKASLPTT